MIADIVVGLSFGDEGKGKVTHHLLKNGDYTHVLRFGGGANAGHTIYHNGEKLVTHLIPVGVVHGIRSIIGSGCVLNPDAFFEELQYLKDAGIDVEGKVFIASNAHITTEEHLNEDRQDTKIGTTKRGIGPTYRDKYAREGLLAKDVPELAPYIVDLYHELHEGDEEAIVLCEGAQGFGLDVDWGDYPYVTTSHCTSAGALLNSIPPQAVRKVYGIAKAYDTYVGAKNFHGEGRVFDLLQNLGNEFGATTGRPRQCNWLNVRDLKKAADINGVTDVIINKVDILRQVGEWNLRSSNNNAIMLKLGSEVAWKQYVTRLLNDNADVNVVFSESPERI